MVKELYIDYHLDGYSILVNNCIDYTIAGASSYYHKEFLKLYCALWSMKKNYCSDYHDLTRDTLHRLGLELLPIDESQGDEVINSIIKALNAEEVVLFNTNTSALFYSVKFKEKNFGDINHNFIICGYDNDKELLYIKENTINSDLLRSLTYCHPFSTYKITFGMFLDIYAKTKDIIKNKELLVKIVQKEVIDIFALKKEIYNNSIDFLLQQKDCLLAILHNIKNSYDNYFYSEQFFRDYYYSLDPLFDVIEELVFAKQDLQNIKKDFLRMRKKIIILLAKAGFSQKSNKSIQIADLAEKMNALNIALGNFLLRQKDKISLSYNLIDLKDVVIKADSDFNSDFVCGNVILDKQVNNAFCFWRSSNEFIDHWISVEFSCPQVINKIVIEHHKFNHYVTKDYDIFVKCNNETDFHLLTEIRDNRDTINVFTYQTLLNVITIKIVIYLPNSGIDFSARIRNIRFYT